MVILPIWLWLVFFVVVVLGWLARSIYRAGAKTIRDAAVSSALERGQALPASQAALDETQRALAAYDNVQPDALTVQFTLAPVDASIGSRRLNGPLVLMASTRTLLLRSRRGASAADYTFIRRREEAALLADGVCCRLRTDKGTVIDVRLTAPTDAAQLAAWMNHQATNDR